MTLTIVTNQLLESLDRGGCWGNLADVLAFLDGGAGETDRQAARGRLLPNLPSPVLLVIDEESAMVEGYLARLGNVAVFTS